LGPIPLIVFVKNFSDLEIYYRYRRKLPPVADFTVENTLFLPLDTLGDKKEKGVIDIDF